MLTPEMVHYTKVMLLVSVLATSYFYLAPTIKSFIKSFAQQVAKSEY